MSKTFGLALTLGLALAGATADAADAAKIVVIAGTPSHGPGDHEFNAGCKLLVECLKKVPGVEPVFVGGGWPKDESVFDGAKSVVFFMDGGGGHPIIQGDHLSTVKRLMDAGVGLVCLHYAVEIPKDKGGPSSSTGSAAITRAATRRTRTGSPTSRACRPTRSRAGSSRSRSRMNGIITCGSGPR